MTACSIMQDISAFGTGGALPQRPSAWADTAVGPPCRDPLPQLLTAGKPICAATIRVGLGYLEVRSVAVTGM